jgi:hypothetical protein
MRVYVPKGAQLISVKGHTRETVKDPLDYNALDFQRDELLEKIEGSLSVHPESGTQIFEESGKTVFGNWVYVSPKESVTVEYTYILPFRMVQSEKQKEIPYSLLTQKQSGSLPSSFMGTVSYPKDWKISWFSPSGIRKQSEGMIYEGSLATDVFQGYVFERK